MQSMQLSARSMGSTGKSRPGERASTFDMRMTSTLGAKESDTHISLVDYTRVQPPGHYQAPLRSTPSQAREVHQVHFDRIKASAKSSVPDTNLSKKADYKILASSTRRAGDPMKAAVSHYNLGVVADNAQQFKKACTCYKKFIAAVRSAAAAEAATTSGSVSARMGASDASALWSSRTSASVGGEPSEAAASPTRARMGRTHRHAEALGFNALAISTSAGGDLEGALIYHAEHAKAAPDAQGRVVALVNAGMVHRGLGNLEDSDACFQAALKLALAEGDDAGEMLAAGHIGLNAVATRPFLSSTPPSTAATGGPAPPTGPSPPPSASPARGRRFVRGAATAAGAAPSPISSKPVVAAQAPGGGVRGAVRCLDMDEMGLERAKDALTTLLQLHARGDDPRNVGRGHSALGTIAFARGLLQDSAAHFHEAARAAKANRDAAQSRLDRCQLGMAVAAQQMEAYMAAVGEAAGEAAAGGAAPGPPVLATAAAGQA